MTRIFSIVALSIILSTMVFAQTSEPRPDVPLLQTGGIYNMGCHAPSDTDLLEMCFVRTDVTPIVELGCTPVQPDQDIRMDLNIVPTQGDNAEIRCYAKDTSGLVSDYSENAGIVDFTRPGRPYVN